MGKSKELRLIAASIVCESKISKEGKLKLLNFIKELASDAQIKVLLMDGRITILDEQTEEIVNERFKNHSLNEADPLSIYVGMMAGMFVAIASKLAYDTARLAWSKGHRLCLKYKGNEKQKCLAKYKKMSIEKQLQILAQHKGKCNTTKNPKACVAGIDKKMQQAKKKLDNIIL